MGTRSSIRGDEVTAPAGIDPSAPSLAASSSTPSGPAVLAGRYELLGLLAVGGMGSVYRARDAELGEIVALKVLRKELVDAPGMLDRFRQEVRLARRVTHVNVARMYDIGEHAGEKFLTMELIDGESLGDRLERLGGERVLPMREVVGIGRAICAGLSAAHGAGVVHRDLKPDNVLLAKDGRVAITDFGIARAVEGAMAGSAMTRGTPIGTPAYMAPEQVEAAQDVDARADLYALGAMLYEMMTGARAWEGESVYSVAAARLVHPPPDPRAKKPDLPESAARLVLQLMAKKREERPARAEEVDAALAAIELRPHSRVRASVPAHDLVLPEADVAKTVAVLPFRNAGKDDDDYVADGLTDDLIDALSMTRGLRVLARGAVMPFKQGDRDVRAIGRELGVQVVVDGSIRKAGDMLRIGARVVSVADGFQLWAKRFDASEKDILKVGDEVADAIARALTLERDAPARVAPTDPAALDLYLRARHAYHESWAAGTLRAIALFEEALARAPDDPKILSGYALAQLRRFGQDPDPAIADDAGEKGRAAAERALARSPNLAEARSALATYRWSIGDPVACAREVRALLAAAPDSVDALDLAGRLLVEIGEPQKGIALLESALALEPHLFRARADAVRVRALLGDFAAADAFFATPPQEESNLNTFGLYAARLAGWRGDEAWTRATFARLGGHEYPFRASVGALFDFVLAAPAAELPPPMMQTLERWGRAGSKSRRRPIFFRQLTAELFALAQQDRRALEMIADADRMGLVDVVWIDHCPVFERLRGDVRFIQTRASVAARAALVLDALRGA